MKRSERGKTWTDEDISYSPTDEQLDIVSDNKNIYRDYFYCFLNSGAVVYHFPNGYVKVTELQKNK